MVDLGRLGEDAAAAFLRRAGYELLARNWRTGRYEIDLVMRDGETVVFVEVKSRNPGPQDPESAVDSGKRTRLCHAAARWVATSREPARDYRFDVVAVRAGVGDHLEVTHIPDAFTGDDASRPPRRCRRW